MFLSLHLVMNLILCVGNMNLVLDEDEGETHISRMLGWGRVSWFDENLHPAWPGWLVMLVA
jgi:hypothetical protein